MYLISMTLFFFLALHVFVKLDTIKPSNPDYIIYLVYKLNIRKSKLSVSFPFCDSDIVTKRRRLMHPGICSILRETEHIA